MRRRALCKRTSGGWPMNLWLAYESVSGRLVLNRCRHYKTLLKRPRNINAAPWHFQVWNSLQLPGLGIWEKYGFFHNYWWFCISAVTYLSFYLKFIIISRSWNQLWGLLYVLSSLQRSQFRCENGKAWVQHRLGLYQVSRVKGDRTRKFRVFKKWLQCESWNRSKVKREVNMGAGSHEVFMRSENSCSGHIRIKKLGAFPLWLSG